MLTARIFIQGDNSVGINDQTWTINNIVVEDETHRDLIIDSLKDAFSLIGFADRHEVQVTFSDEDEVNPAYLDEVDSFYKNIYSEFGV